jgi:hypothetical protein
VVVADPPARRSRRRHGDERLHLGPASTDVHEAVVRRHVRIATTELGITGPSDHRRPHLQHPCPAGIDAACPPQRGGGVPARRRRAPRHQ